MISLVSVLVAVICLVCSLVLWIDEKLTEKYSNRIYRRITEADLEGRNKCLR